MAKISGKNLYVSWAGTEYSAYIRNFDVSEATETADATAGADSYRNYVETVKTIDVSFEVVMDEYASNGSAMRSAFENGTEGTLIWGVEGSATGKPKKGFYGRIVDASESIPFDDVNTFSVSIGMAGTALAFNGITDKFS